MLEAFDDFFQMHTLFKVPVFLQKIGIIDNIKGICFDKQFFETDAIQMNYLMREQDEAEEERFRKLDAAIRMQHKGRRFRKEKEEFTMFAASEII